LKENFLQVYGKAYRKALKPELIQTAFCKTGIVLFDTPIILPNPVLIVTDLLVNTIQSPINSSTPKETMELECTQQPLPVCIAIPQLALTEANFLMSQSPIKSSLILAEMPTTEILLVKQPGHKEIKSDLHTIEVKI
jgi:hypothetical protein